jgi:hypothetical protein
MFQFEFFQTGKYYRVGVASEGIMFISNFMKATVLDQKLKVERHTHTLIFS